MTLFRVQAYDEDEGRMIGWAKTERQARLVLAEWRRAGYDFSDPVIEAINFNPNRDGILGLLKRYTPERDNG